MNDKKQNDMKKNVNDVNKDNSSIIKSNIIKTNNDKDNKYNKVIYALVDKDNDNNDNNINNINNINNNKKENEIKESFYKYNLENLEKIESMGDDLLIKNSIGQENIQPTNKFQNKIKNNFGKKVYDVNPENNLKESKEEEEKEDLNKDNIEKLEDKNVDEKYNTKNLKKIEKGELDLTYNFDDDVYNVTQEQMGILDGDVNKIYNKYKNNAQLKHFKIKHPYFQHNVKMINNNIEFIVPHITGEERKKRLSPIIEKQKLILEKIKKDNISRSNISLSNNNSNSHSDNQTKNKINISNKFFSPYKLNQLNNNSNGNVYTNTNQNENSYALNPSYNHYIINNNNRYNNIISYKNQNNNIQRYQNLFSYSPLSSDNRTNDKMSLSHKRKIIYEPYTLIEYKNKYENSNKNGKKLGGLGANLGGEEWLKRQKMFERKKQYSDYVKNDNDEDFKKLNKKKIKLKNDNYEITKTITSKKSSEYSIDRLSEPINKRYNIIKTENNIRNSKEIKLPLIKERFKNNNNKKLFLKNSGDEKYKIKGNIEFDKLNPINGNEKDLKQLIKQYEEYNGKF